MNKAIFTVLIAAVSMGAMTTTASAWGKSHCNAAFFAQSSYGQSTLVKHCHKYIDPDSFVTTRGDHTYTVSEVFTNVKGWRDNGKRIDRNDTMSGRYNGTLPNLGSNTGHNNNTVQVTDGVPVHKDDLFLNFGY